MAIVSQKQRKRIVERAGGLCEGILESGQRCCSPGDWRGLQIHHDPPKRIGGTKRAYKDEELILLCGKHHSEAEGIKEV